MFEVTLSEYVHHSFIIYNIPVCTSLSPLSFTFGGRRVSETGELSVKLRNGSRVAKKPDERRRKFPLAAPATEVDCTDDDGRTSPD